MKKISKILSLIGTVILVMGLMAGCGEKKDSSSVPSEEGAATVTEAIVETGVVEGEAATEMVDKVIGTVTSNTFSSAPFQPPSPGMQFKAMLYATLINQPYTGALLEDCEMWLAKSVTKVDDYTYDIELYDYITDSKGNTIDAEDVIYSLEMSRTLAQQVDISTYVEEITQTGDYSIRMKINTTLPGIIETILGGGQLNIVDKQWYESASDEEKQNDPATTGAYRVVEFIPGSSITMEALDEYWQTEELTPSVAKRNVKTVEIKAIVEASMRSIGLENHEIDVARIAPSDLERFYENGSTKDGWNLVIQNGTSLVCAFLNMDENTSVFAENADLRKAVLYCLDGTDLMLAMGFSDVTATPLKAFGIEKYSGYEKAWEEEDYYDYDITKAQESLENAGYKSGEVTVRVLVSSAMMNDAFRSVLVANLELAGFKVDMLAVDQALYNTYKNDSTQWDLLIDTKSSTGGTMAGFYDPLFNPAGYTNGSVCFTHDEQLLELLEDVGTKNDSESLTAFHNYIRDNAIAKGLYVSNNLYIAQDGILSLPLTYGYAPAYNSATYAVDYQSLIEK